MKLETKKSAVDLTDLAVGIIVLGVVVSIGATVLLNMRDARLTDMSTYNTLNESFNPGNDGASGGKLTNKWFKGITQIKNQSGDFPISSGNYTVSTSQIDGTATITNTTNSWPGPWNVTYSAYNVTRADFSVPNNASTGLAEYGNWFKIIVIVGVAAVVLSLIFMAFGRNAGGNSGGGIGGEY